MSADPGQTSRTKELALAYRANASSYRPALSSKRPSPKPGRSVRIATSTEQTPPGSSAAQVVEPMVNRSASCPPSDGVASTATLPLLRTLIVRAATVPARREPKCPAVDDTSTDRNGSAPAAVKGRVVCGSASESVMSSMAEWAPARPGRKLTVMEQVAPGSRATGRLPQPDGSTGWILARLRLHFSGGGS